MKKGKILRITQDYNSVHFQLIPTCALMAVVGPKQF